MALADEYTEIIADQAPDWSDLRFELELLDEATFDEARLMMAPTQFERIAGTRNRFTFRVSHRRGYGCHVDLAKACLARLDERRIQGGLTLEQVLYEVKANMTQGPVVS